MPFRQRRRLIAAGSRRQTSWLDIEPVFVNIVGGVLTHVMTAAEIAKLPFTVIRTHVAVNMSSDQIIAGEGGIGGYGGCVVTAQAEAIGITAIPTPILDMASDSWFLHTLTPFQLVFATAVGFDDHSGETFHYESKAMRKVSEDERLIFVAESAAAQDGANIRVAGRILIKEH